METKPIWFDFATFDKEGYINGVRADAPPEVKKAFKQDQDRLKRYRRTNKPIPR